MENDFNELPPDLNKELENLHTYLKEQDSIMMELEKIIKMHTVIKSNNVVETMILEEDSVVFFNYLDQYRTVSDKINETKLKIKALREKLYS